jgi:histone-lysine N-methyltransferase SETMAR
MTVTNAWNPLGFHLLHALSKGNTFNAEYYRVDIITELLPLCPQIGGRKLVIHADNARPGTAGKCRVLWKERWLRLGVHPPYSPDLAPSDFFPFGQIKQRLQVIAFPSREELLAVIHEIVGAISRPTLEDMFRHWMEGLELVSQNNGDSYL